MNTRCLKCNKPIPTTSSPHNKGQIKYCSKTCKIRASLGRRGYKERQAQCLYCKKDFAYNAKTPTTRKYCSNECRSKAYGTKYKARNPHNIKLPPSTIGAISEILVSADLLSYGCEVFRAMSPSCSCDLAVLYKNRLYRVEVKTGCLTPAGTLVLPPIRNPDAYDILAAVYDQGSRIEYWPRLEEIWPDTPTKEGRSG